MALSTVGVAAGSEQALSDATAANAGTSWIIVPRLVLSPAWTGPDAPLFMPA
jgi:hypothetical protein